jgi:hypothetical protein
MYSNRSKIARYKRATSMGGAHQRSLQQCPVPKPREQTLSSGPSLPALQSPCPSKNVSSPSQHSHTQAMHQRLVHDSPGVHLPKSTRNVSIPPKHAAITAKNPPTKTPSKNLPHQPTSSGPIFPVPRPRPLQGARNWTQATEQPTLNALGPPQAPAQHRLPTCAPHQDTAHPTTTWQRACLPSGANRRPAPSRQQLPPDRRTPPPSLPSTTLTPAHRRRAPCATRTMALRAHATEQDMLPTPILEPRDHTASSAAMQGAKR